MNYNNGINAFTCMCISYGERNVDKKCIVAPVMRDTYVLFYILSGSGTFVIDGVNYNVKKGNSVAIFPYSSIKIKSSNENISYRWVETKGFEISDMISRTGFAKNQPVAPCMPIENFEKYYDIVEDCADLDYAACRTNGKIAVLFSYYMEYFPSEKTAVINYVMSARDYIERNYKYSHCTVQSVANYVKLDRTYLYRLFKSETGMSVIEYINKCRINKACSMLLDTNIQIKDIALSVGFIDQLYFSKVFKKQNGKSPSEYRNTHIKSTQ